MAGRGILIYVYSFGQPDGVWRGVDLLIVCFRTCGFSVQGSDVVTDGCVSDRVVACWCSPTVARLSCGRGTNNVSP